MEEEAGPARVASVDVSPTATSPSHDSDFTPVGSPEEDLSEVHALPSDDDQEHEQEDEHENGHDHDEDHDHDQLSVPVVQTEDRKQKIIKQVEYYFSDQNLPTDKYMISLIKKNKEGFDVIFMNEVFIQTSAWTDVIFRFPITVITSFRKMKKLTQDHSLILAALRESSFLVVSTDGKKVKRLHPFPLSEVKDRKFCTVLVENLPEDHSVGNIRRIFGESGKIRNISFHDPHTVGESKKGKVDILISSKLHALVEYETVEAAEKAVATLNDEQDWRNGMHVKLLKQLGKYGQRRRAWREYDTEKNGSGHISNQTGDEENHNLSEHHDDTHDEEDGEHVSKEKISQRGRNRGRPRRNKYCVTDGMGHGTTSSAHAIEAASKPPPGPKMPDGTRGFTVGRGRPPMPNQNQ